MTNFYIIYNIILFMAVFHLTYDKIYDTLTRVRKWRNIDAALKTSLNSSIILLLFVWFELMTELKQINNILDKYFTL